MNKSDLRYYRGMVAEVHNLQKRLAELEAAMSSPSRQKFSRTPSGPGDVDRTMDAVIANHQRLAVMYKTKAQELSARMLDVEQAVESLQDPDERMLLRYRYLDGKTWEAIGRIMHYGLSSVHRLHGRALQHLSNRR